MDKLAKHITQDSWMDLFPQEVGVNAIGIVYSCLKAAANASADTIVCTRSTISWYKKAQLIHTFDTALELIAPHINFCDLIHVAIKFDGIVQSHLNIVSESEFEVNIELI